MYQLMVRKSKYENIKIRQHPGFIIDSNLQSNHLATLKEIDLLTTQFANMPTFISSLVVNKLLPIKDAGNQISIRYSDNGKMVTLSNSIIFSDGKTYLNTNTLLNTLRILSNDRKFMNLLLSKYMPKDDAIYYTREYVNLNTLQALEAVLNNDINLYRLRSFLLPYRYIISNKKLIDSDTLYGCETDEVVNALIEIFFHNEVFKRHFVKGYYRPEYDDYGDYYKFDKDSIQYKKLHDLAKFTSVYDLNRKKCGALEEKECQEEFLEPEDYVRSNVSFRRRVEQPQTKPKKIVKRKKEPLEGQTSLFD